MAVMSVTQCELQCLIVEKASLFVHRNQVVDWFGLKSIAVAVGFNLWNLTNFLVISFDVFISVETARNYLLHCVKKLEQVHVGVREAIPGTVGILLQKFVHFTSPDR